MARAEFSRKTKREALERSGYRCEATGPSFGFKEGQRASRSKSKGIKWVESLVAAPQSDDCIPWPFSARDSGYGQIFYQGKRTTSNRFICEMFRGPAPFDGAHAAHECGRRDCCNPKHIMWKTVKDNQADKERHGTKLIGSQIKWAKLSEEKVKDIRARLDSGATLDEIAEKFGVARSTIWEVKARKIWRHV